MTKKNQDNSFNFRFQNWERSKIEKTTCKHVDNSSFPLSIFLIKIRIRDFLLDIDSAYKKFCLNSRYRTGSFWIQKAFLQFYFHTIQVLLHGKIVLNHRISCNLL